MVLPSVGRSHWSTLSGRAEDAHCPPQLGNGGQMEIGVLGVWERGSSWSSIPHWPTTSAHICTHKLLQELSAPQRIGFSALSYQCMMCTIAPGSEDGGYQQKGALSHLLDMEEGQTASPCWYRSICARDRAVKMTSVKHCFASDVIVPDTMR